MVITDSALVADYLVTTVSEWVVENEVTRDSTLVADYFVTTHGYGSQTTLLQQTVNWLQISLLQQTGHGL